MLNEFVHILIELTNKHDCRFIGSWLIRAAEAEAFWSEALRDAYFADWVSPMCDYYTPNLECAALEILGALKQQDHVVAVDLDWAESAIFSTEFAMMMHLGFFERIGRSYQVIVPESVTLARVQQAALRVMSTAKYLRDGLEIVEPELLLHTVPQTEAEAWRSWLIQMRRFNSNTRDEVMRLVGGVRLCLSNAGFRVLMKCGSEVGT